MMILTNYLLKTLTFEYNLGVIKLNAQKKEPIDEKQHIFNSKTGGFEEIKHSGSKDISSCYKK